MKILVVDDHPLTVFAYVNLFKESLNNCIIHTAHNCEQAYNEITNCPLTDPFDLVVCDYNLPKFEKGSIDNGGDIIRLAKDKLKAKSIVITAHQEFLFLYSILKSVQPNGLLAKSDISHQNLSLFIRDVLEDKLTYSPFIEECIKKIWDNEILVDDYNREILLLLAKGYKIKDIHELVTLAPITINKRIAKIRQAFKLSPDLTITKELLKRGYL